MSESTLRIARPEGESNLLAEKRKQYVNTHDGQDFGSIDIRLDSQLRLCIRYDPNYQPLSSLSVSQECRDLFGNDIVYESFQRCAPSSNSKSKEKRKINT